jgi:hypothetical protein
MKYLYCVIDDFDYIDSIEETTTEKTELAANEYPMAYTDWYPSPAELIVDGKKIYQLKGGTYFKIG